MELKALLSRITGALPTLVAGGFAGAVFTWYMNRPVPTVITYSVTSTTTETGTTVKSLIPNLKMQIGDKEVSRFITHVIEIQAQSGPQVGTADVAITFLPKVEIFGMNTEAPSPLHSITCSPIPEGAKCPLFPLTLAEPHTTSNKYRVNIATDQVETINVITTADKVKLIQLDELLVNQRRFRENIINGSLIVFMIILLVLISYKVRQVLQSLQSSQRLTSELEEINQVMVVKFLKEKTPPK